MVNQQAIATALGLSTATVSRALRNRGNHDARTRALVLEEAARLGYRLPRRIEVAATPVRVPAIGVLLATLHPRHSDLPTVALRLLQGISSTAIAAGLMLHLEYLPNDDNPATVDPLASPALRQGNLDGLIHIGDAPPTVMAALTKRFIGVRIARRDPGIALDGIGQDDVAALAELVGHLRGLGHERIGFLGDGLARSFVHARAAAFLQAMLQSGRPLAAATLVNVGAPALDEAAWTAAVLAAIAAGTRAWICLHDNRGYDLIRLLHQCGLRVPEEVSVCGFDALPVPHGLPAMTTIDWPFEELGAEAVKRLLRRLEAPDEPIRQVVLPGTLLVRATTARAP